MQTLKRALLSLILASAAPSFSLQSCRWNHEIVDSFTLESRAYLRPGAALKNLTGILMSARVDFFTDRSNQTNQGFFGFPNFLKLYLRCDSEDTSSQMRNMGLVDQNPRVLLRLTSFDDNTLRITKRQLLELEGVLVDVSDPAQLQGSDSVTKSSSALSWLVPLPVNDNVLTVDVTVSGIKNVHGPESNRFLLNWEFLDHPDPNGLLGLTRTSLPNFPWPFPTDTPNTVSSMPLPMVLVPGTGSVIFYTLDDWRTVEILNFTKRPSAKETCSVDPDRPWIFRHAVLHDRLLLATNVMLNLWIGAAAIHSRNTEVGQRAEGKRHPSKMCDQDAVPQLDALDGVYLAVLTDGGEILTAPYFASNGSLVFTTALSSADFAAVVERMLPGYSMYTIVDVVEVTSRGVLALLGAVMPTSPDNTETSKHCLITIDSNHSVTLRSCLPAFIPVVDKNLPFTVVTNQIRLTNVPTTIIRVIRSDVIAKEYYAIGNSIYFSSDGGLSWKYFSSFPPGRTVNSVQVSRSGSRLLVLTATSDNMEDEIWVSTWSQPQFHKVYPTSAWEMSLMLSTKDSSLAHAWQRGAAGRSLLTIYFNWFGNPVQVFNVVNATGSWETLRIPLLYTEIIASLSSSMLGLNSGTLSVKSFSAKDCPQVQVKVARRHFLERLEYYRFLKPRTGQTCPVAPVVATIYSATVQTLLNYSVKSMDNNYTSSEAGYMEHVSGYFEDSPMPARWQFEKTVARSEANRIVILDGDNQNTQLADDDEAFAEFPQRIFIDRGDAVVVMVSISNFVPSGSFGVQEADFPQISFRMENGSLIKGTTEASYDPEKRILSYKITLQETGTLTPAPPGGNLVKEAFSLIIPQPLECYPNNALYETTIHIGCLPATELQYNWHLVLVSSTTNKTNFDCTDPEPNMPCIDHSGSVNLFLELVDHAGNQGYNFTGQYRMFITGFGLGHPKDIQRFNESEVSLYNAELSDGSNSKKLIWIPLNDSPLYANDTRILDHFHNKIQFICSSESPCGDPKISIAEEPHLNFLVRVTNGGLPDVTTYCLFDLEFIVRVRGADPNPYTVSIPVLVVTLIVLLVLCGLYVGLYFWRLRIAAAYTAYMHTLTTESGSGDSSSSVHYTLSHKSVMYAAR